MLFKRLNYLRLRTVLLLMIIFILIFVAWALFYKIFTVENYIEMFKTILSWPVIAAILIVGILYRFEYEIRAFLTKSNLIKLPGGFEVQAQVIEQNIYENQQVKELINEIAISHELKQDVVNRNKGLQTECLFWEFEYLKLFLVPQTKLILAWLSTLGSFTLFQYEQNCLPVLNTKENVDTTISALMHHKLIENHFGDSVNFYVSEKGKAFLTYIGEIVN